MADVFRSPGRIIRLEFRASRIGYCAASQTLKFGKPASGSNSKVGSPNFPSLKAGNVRPFALLLSCIFRCLFDCRYDFGEVCTFDIGHAEVFCGLFIQALLVKRCWRPPLQVTHNCSPKWLRLAEVLSDFLVNWDWEVGGKVAAKDGFARVSW